MENKLGNDTPTLELLKVLNKMTQEEREELLSLWKNRETAR